jgi:hypothetical protein
MVPEWMTAGWTKREIRDADNARIVKSNNSRGSARTQRVD